MLVQIVLQRIVEEALSIFKRLFDGYESVIKILPLINQ